ncbi:MAG: type II toxin-antitoxin system RelE/ParE family toxin [Bacteroidia bacterium]
MKVVFTDIASKRLRDIYAYYKQEASLTVAKSVKGKIIGGIRNLETNPKLGSEETYLLYLKRGYRKIVIGNYKIIYRVIDSTVVVDTIFDSRQEPKELSKDITGKKK